jgi:hypothetical protein
MIGAEVSAFFKVSKALRQSLSNSKGMSLAKRLVSGLAICEKSFYKPMIKTSMAKKTSYPFNVNRWR